MWGQAQAGGRGQGDSSSSSGSSSSGSSSSSSHRSSTVVVVVVVVVSCIMYSKLTCFIAPVYNVNHERVLSVYILFISTMVLVLN
jgi:hypothetical protein